MEKFTYITANNGFCYLMPLKDENGKFNGKFSRIPIVAWKVIEGDNIAHPISLDGGVDEFAISSPGDIYITDYDAWYDSLDEYADHLRKTDELRDENKE